MRSISYAGEHLITTETVATALLAYAASLAGAGASDVVRIPIVHSDRSIRSAELVIGPASQIVTLESDEDEVDLDDAAVVASLSRRAREVQTPTASAEDPLSDSRHSYGD